MTLLLVGIFIGVIFGLVWDEVLTLFDLYREERDNDRNPW